MEFIKKLRPVTYNLDVTGISEKLDESRGQAMNEQMKKAIADKEKIIYTGFIAQEVEKAAADCGYDFSGVDKPKNENDLYGLRYAEFVVPLVKAMQELNKDNEELKTKCETLAKQNEETQKEIAQIKSAMDEAQQQKLNDLQSTIPKAELMQNVPNPFNKNTVIKYNVPVDFVNARIKIYSAQGVEMKSYTITKSGRGEVSVEANAFTAGIYSYSLIVDDNATDVKQMIVTK